MADEGDTTAFDEAVAKVESDLAALGIDTSDVRESMEWARDAEPEELLDEVTEFTDRINRHRDAPTVPNELWVEFWDSIADVVLRKRNGSSSGLSQEEGK